MQTHHRPDLRPSILALLDTLVPAVRDGGSVPLTALVAAVAGDKLEPEVRAKLDGRGDALFVKKGPTTFFSNEGPALRIPLKRFDLKIPARIAGEANLLDDGASLRFRRPETLIAAKLVFSVQLERIDATSRRVFVALEGGTFDQCLDLV